MKYSRDVYISKITKEHKKVFYQNLYELKLNIILENEKQAYIGG